MAKQERFQLAAKLESGEDENGVYDIIPISMVKGGELKPFKVYRKPIKHIINSSNPTPRGWYKDKIVPDRVRPRPCYTEALLTTPYGGRCIINCKFCYVSHGTRGYRATGLATVSPSYPDAMKKQIANMQICPAAYISSFNEPFPILEDTYHITQRLTQVLLDEGLPLFYLSRMIPPDWALEALQQNPYSYMQWSVNSSKTEVYKKLSPGSFTIERWLQEVERYRKAGIYVSIQCNPILPGITTLDDLKELIRVGAQAGINHIIFKFAEQVFNNRKLLIDRLTKVPGVDEFDRLFNQTIGGVYTIQQDVRVEWLNELLQCTRDNDITMSLCYEYYDNGKGGGNMAPYFTTSDGCHGRGVPMFYRPKLGAKFEPLPGCYRKGCLYCAEYGTQACKHSILLQAKALVFRDYKNIRLMGDADNWALVDSCASPIEVVDDCGCNDNLQTDIEIWNWKE